MRAIQTSSFGKPSDVLKVVDIPEPPAPASGEVLIGVESAPINPYDLLLIKGTFHYTPSLPTIVGNEGVGRILAFEPSSSSRLPGSEDGGADRQWLPTAGAHRSIFAQRQNRDTARLGRSARGARLSLYQT